MGERSCRRAPIGSPSSPAPAAPGRSVGWTADASLVQVDDATYLGDGCVVLATSPPTERRHGHVSTAMVRGRQAVAQASSVSTELPARTRTVTVLLEGTAAELPHLTIGGAVAAGAPTVLQIGARTAMVVDVKPTGDAGVTVTVVDQRSLAGVIGSAAPADEVVTQLGARGLTTFGPLSAVTAGGAGTIRWRDR